MNQTPPLKYERKGDYLYMQKANPDDDVTIPPSFEIIAELQGGYLCIGAYTDGQKYPMTNFLTFVRSEAVTKSVGKL